MWQPLNLSQYLNQYMIVIKSLQLSIYSLNQLTMSEGNSLNLSIQLQENQQKRQQELDEFVELTKKIAESDRNNDLLRQIKKSKLAQASKIRMAHCQVLEEKQAFKQKYDDIAESLKQEKLLKARRNQQLQQLNGRFDHLSKKERILQEQSNSLGKDNDKLEKQVLTMQDQLEELIRKNRQKETTLSKLKRIKEQQQNNLKDNQNKILELQLKCERSKEDAESLQLKLKRKYESNENLQRIIKEKDEKLKRMKKQKEQNVKRQQDIKRTNNKLMQKAKLMEQDIDKKKAQLSRVQQIHERLELQVQKFITSQKNYEQILLKRSEILMQLKKDCERVKRQNHL